MKKCTLCLLSSACFIFGSSAVAAPLYVGVGYGNTNFDSIDLQYDSPPADVSDDQDSAAKIFFGNYLSPIFSWEIAYTDLGSYTATSQGNYDVSMDLEAFSFALLAHHNLHPRWDFFAKLGIAYWGVDLNYNDFTNAGSGDQNDWSPLIGLGFNYTITDNLLLGIEWEQYQNVGQDTNVTLPGSALELNGNDVDVFGLRITYKYRFAPGP